MAVHGVKQRLAGLLALDSSNLKQTVQLVLSHRYLFNHMQLLWVKDVQHVVKDGLQVAWVESHLPQNRVLLFCWKI